jgi:hypothetical protein
LYQIGNNLPALKYCLVLIVSVVDTDGFIKHDFLGFDEQEFLGGILFMNLDWKLFKRL